MSKGKAVRIVLTGHVRAILETERNKLEGAADREAAFFAKVRGVSRKIGRYEETHVLALLRIKAILLAADGHKNKEIADQLEVSQHTVGKWRRDFAYILSREDLPVQRIAEFFWYIENPVRGVLQEFQKDEI